MCPADQGLGLYPAEQGLRMCPADQGLGLYNLKNVLSTLALCGGGLFLGKRKLPETLHLTTSSVNEIHSQTSVLGTNYMYHACGCS